MASSRIVVERQENIRDRANLEADVFVNKLLEERSVDHVDSMTYSRAASFDGNLNVIVSNFPSLSRMEDLLVIFIRELGQNLIRNIIIRFLTAI